MSIKGRVPSGETAPKVLTPTSTPNGRPRSGVSFDGGHPDGSLRGRGREQVYEIQRARMLGALVEVANEHGAANVTVAHVVGRSGVSRRTFYEIFEDREDCFLAALDDAIGEIAGIVVPACEQLANWQDRIRAGLTTLLEFLDHEPGAGRLVIVEALGAGPRALERRQRALAYVIAAIDEGRSEARQGDGPPALTAEGVVGAVLSVLHARLLDSSPPDMCPPGHPAAGPRKGCDDSGGLVELAGPLMSMIVLPYLGPAAARREAARPPAKSTGRTHRTGGHPLRHPGMRLTYRTMRVLSAIATHPGSSNRAIADAAGISDQGQTSKLLRRLLALGLIENAGPGRVARGEPNSWQLTAKGLDIECAIAKQATKT